MSVTLVAILKSCGIIVSEVVSFKSMENSSHFLCNTVDEIVSANIELNNGINLISKNIYNISSKIFGETKQFKQYKYRRKFNSKWFNQACETARREFVAKRIVKVKLYKTGML